MESLIGCNTICCIATNKRYWVLFEVTALTAPTFSFAYGGLNFLFEYSYRQTDGTLTTNQWDTIKKSYKTGFVFGLFPILIPASPVLIPTYYIMTTK